MSLKKGDSTIKKKAVVTSIYLSHVLRLVFPLMQNATVYTHLHVCLEIGRFGIKPVAAHLLHILLPVGSLIVLQLLHVDF